jgi:nitrate/nitrite transporter NarK
MTVFQHRGAPQSINWLKILSCFADLLNAAGAVAGILSPVAFGWILDRTGSWTTPFVFSVELLLSAIIMTYWIRPDRPIEAIPRIGGLAVAGE